MDVSIKSTDKQIREANIKARDKKQTASDARREKRELRRKSRRDHIIDKRLRRKIVKEVRADLLNEKRCFREGDITGSAYSIDASVTYHRRSWYSEEQYVKDLLEEILATHAGFEFKADYDCFVADNIGWCRSIKIWYTLLES